MKAISNQLVCIVRTYKMKNVAINSLASRLFLDQFPMHFIEKVDVECMGSVGSLMQFDVVISGTTSEGIPFNTIYEINVDNSGTSNNPLQSRVGVQYTLNTLRVQYDSQQNVNVFIVTGGEGFVRYGVVDKTTNEMEQMDIDITYQIRSNEYYIDFKAELNTNQYKGWDISDGVNGIKVYKKSQFKITKQLDTVYVFDFDKKINKPFYDLDQAMYWCEARLIHG